MTSTRPEQRETPSPRNCSRPCLPLAVNGERGTVTPPRLDAAPTGPRESVPMSASLTHPVVELLRRRRSRETAGHGQPDEARLAVAVEGGALRGVVSAGMLVALDSLGFGRVFDAAYGVSAGAINAAAFVSGAASDVPRFYMRLCNDARFFSWRRVLTHTPLLSLDYVLDRAQEAVDFDSIVTARTSLHVVATSLRDTQPMAFSGFRSGHDVIQALRASMTIPWVAGPPTLVNGEMYLDGAVVESIGASSAIDEGATHVLVLATQPRRADPEPAVFEKRVMHHRLRQLELEDAYQRRLARLIAEVTALERSSASSRPPHVLAIKPPADGVVSPLERKPDRIRKGGIAGARAAYLALEGREPTQEEIRPFWAT